MRSKMKNIKHSPERKIVVSVGSDVIRAALLEGGRPVEFHVEKIDKCVLAGAIVKGRVSNILPGLQAAFVDAGLERDVFVHVLDITECPHLKHTNDFDQPGSIGYAAACDKAGAGNDSRASAHGQNGDIRQLLRVGQEIVLQIVKDPIDSKGARGSTRISLPGRYVVLMPHGEGTGISRRIESQEEKERLRTLMDDISPKNMGTIVRTAAEGENRETLTQDIKLLLKIWNSLEQKIASAPVYSVIHRELGLAMKLIRDMALDEAGSVIIDSSEAFAAVQEFIESIAPERKENLLLWEGSEPVFEAFDIEREFSALICPAVKLGCGGTIIIEKTEALTAIDVNTGSFSGGTSFEETIFNTNVEAAAEIARQIRLRNISGLIVVDFIDMQHQQHRDEVFGVLLKALRKDRIRCGASGFTRHGLVEITRKRISPPVTDIITEPCTACQGLGSVPGT